jgi:hypothetical protein
VSCYFLRNDIPGMIYDAGKAFYANLMIVGSATFSESSCYGGSNAPDAAVASNA